MAEKTTSILIKNDGQKITDTNYWKSTYAWVGAYYLSINAGAFRLLVPQSRMDDLIDMRTAKIAVVSIGGWAVAGRDVGIELMFDDGSDDPFTMFFGAEQCDRIPLKSDSGRELVLICYSLKGDGICEELRVRCGFRFVKQIPCMEPWGDKNA